MNYEMTRKEIDLIIGDYEFSYDDKKEQWNMEGLPNGYFISYKKTRLSNGHLCVTVSYQTAGDSIGWRGASYPCYSFQEVKETIQKFYKELFPNRVRQLSIFDLV